ncbi:hypothetical protein [Mycolicibacterium phocaicum]|uniref:Uncharacterized protein n=1 Tax=Mycolicibacterium phocaicum TaxID=319706 RepID=A0A7I7ZKH5_9MYCO|nr:hypothetical protein [Mycolicibacterium phocaicum]TLH68001.1 hypothetical protein C1S79_13615 [Mycolicibacterium phocaicum]BBZ53674.1 hypothetical protein MPHO_06660 [Mycolicibacterium phocaicum]
MWIKTQTVTLSVVCSAAVVVTSAAPVLPTTHPTTHPTTVHSAEYRYALTAATIDAAFNPIRYAGNLGGAAQAVATDVIYWQTPDFPLLVLSAQVDQSTGEHEAVQKVTSTTAHLQSLVSTVTDFPGAASSPQVRQLVSGIGQAGAAAAGATKTVTATLAPHLAPLTPVIYVVRVARAAVGVYYAVATLSTTGVGSVLSGHNPLTAVANVVSSVQGLANVLTHAPRPTAAVATRSTAEPRATAESTSTASKPTAADVTGKRSGKATKSETKQDDSSVTTAQKSGTSKPAKKAKRAAKSDESTTKTSDSKTSDSKKSESKQSETKAKGDHGRSKH